MDVMVYQTQVWLNETYGNHPGYNRIVEDGITGWSTMYALTRALQIELGITETADNFGPTTLRLLGQLGPISRTSNTNENIVKIIQGGLYCKGYGPGGITGYFGPGTEAAVASMQANMGLENADGVVTPKVFKALLTMDAYVLLSGGRPLIRSIQQWLNNKYHHRENFFFIPCDGLYSRNTQKALVYAIQYEEGLSDEIANGHFGPTTQSLLPTIYVGNSDGSTFFVHLFQAAMIFNNYDVPFDGEFTSEVSRRVQEFQEFCALPQTGIGDFQTWASLLVSTGDPNRKGTACDCITEITPARALTLKNEGYETVGRYLTNADGEGSLNKKIQPGELSTIFDAGLTVFPIYQTYGNRASYFNLGQGRIDAEAAYHAAINYGFKHDTTIYFAVDFDALGYEITNNIIPYFKGINQTMSNLGNRYNIGVYGPRSVCIQVSDEGFASTSFVSGMSTGFSGNLGYPLPANWAFDQISTRAIGSGEGYIEIDNNIKSGRDNGSSSVVDDTNLNEDAFNQLENISVLAMFYVNNYTDKPEPIIFWSNYLVTNYYRKNRYTGNRWAVTAGPIWWDFIDFVNNSIGNPKFINITDPVTKIVVDTEHLMATMAAELYVWLDADIEHDIIDFAGWAGDLVTVYKDVTEHLDDYNGDVYECARDLIGSKLVPSYFPFTDLLADVDAVNIAREIIKDRENTTINGAVQDYYGNSVFRRFSRFYQNRFDQDEDTLNSEVRKYVLGETQAIEIMRNQLLNDYHIEPYSDEDGEKLAQAFVDVLLDYVRAC